MNDDENQKNNPETGTRSTNQPEVTPVKPRFDVDALYPHPTVDIYGKPSGANPVSTAQDRPYVTLEDPKREGIEKIVIVLGLITVVTSGLSVAQSAMGALSGKGVDITGGVSIILSVIMIYLGLGLINKRESARFWYVALSFIGLLLVIPTLYAFINFYTSAKPNTASTQIQQEQQQISTQRQIVSERSRISQYNARIAQDQERITSMQTEKDSAALASNIESAKSDIEQTKLDIKESELRIKTIEQDGDKSAQPAGDSSGLGIMIYAIAVSTVSFSLNLVAIIFLTRKRVKAVFR